MTADGQFSSVWPPDYRATYTLHWIVEAGSVVGLSFIETNRNQRFEGRYR